MRCAISLIVRWFTRLLVLVAINVAAQPTPLSGLRATFTTLDDKISDTKITPTLALYVPAGEPATAFLPAGKFRVVWSGFIRADIRDDVSFQAEVNGAFKLEIAGTNVLEVANTRGPSAFSEPVRLKKGLNILRATFTSPMTGDAFVRVSIKSSDGVVQPLDLNHLNCGDSPELHRSVASRDGLNLFLEHRCARCHQVGAVSRAAELNMDAPAFDGIGARLREGWMAKWIADPRKIRPDAHMPKFRVASQPENAQAIAAFLASLGQKTHTEGPKLHSEDVAKARAIFENQHCDVCHFTEGSGVPSLSNWSLKRVAEKFYPDALVDFLEKPDLHFKWTSMPRYRLSRGDCELLASWLIAQSQAFSFAPTTSTPKTIQRGKELVQSQGCLNCHSADLPNNFSTAPLTQTDAAHGGCLTGQQSLDFGFSKIESSLIDVWLTTDRTSLSRNVPSEFVDRHYARLHCAECHQKLENVPPLDNLGAKLHPDWAAKFIAGEIARKPRPWLQSQMPSFPQYATNIAQGLAEQNGFSPKSSTNSVPVAALAEIGEQLAQAPPRGLACVQCHPNGATQPTIADAPGINFSMIAARLQPSYFQRWVRKPSSIDPHTRMPSFFTDEGKSPLTQFFNGNADMQIGAIWEYLQTRRE